MRNLKLCFCLLVSTVFIRGGCQKAAKLHDHDVTINDGGGVNKNCLATPKVVENVHEGDRVDWGKPDRDYTIRFKDSDEPTKNPINLKHGVFDIKHPIKGTKGCDQDPDNPKAYYCKYSITRDGESTPCANFDDPGVHVTPP